MPARDFLDTNVIVYAYDEKDERKQLIAQDLLRRALLGEMMTSSQVLAEFAATLLHKPSRRVDSGVLAAALDALGPIPLVPIDGDVVRRAVDVRAKHGVHFYDGMIVAAAERGGCARLLSEDFSAGQRYLGILAENPFA
jgi:predicted nucleic acid-binding protein